jgi:hypothetical protein
MVNLGKNFVLEFLNFPPYDDEGDVGQPNGLNRTLRLVKPQVMIMLFILFGS